MKPMKILGVLVLFSIILVLMGCAAVAVESSKGATQTVPLATKDFIVIGPIRYTVQSRNAVKDKNLISYDQLLEKAHALGADDVVNVRIDKMMTNPSGLAVVVTYTVNALAIKYTDAVPGAGANHWEVNALSAER